MDLKVTNFTHDMKRTILSALLTTTIMCSANNPFFKPFETPNGTAPFNEIKFEHYEPAVMRGIEKGKEEIEQICSNPETPTFENTIVALERSGDDLNRVLSVFYPLTSALSTPEMMDLATKLTPVLSDYSTSIPLNKRLWERVKSVYDNRSKFNLTPEDEMLLQQTYDSFVQSGANLEGEKRNEFSRLKSEISSLTNTFGQNVLKELNTYEIILKKDELAGLPENIVAEARQLADKKGIADGYLFTLQQPTYMAVMKFADNRDVREKFYKLYTQRNTKGEFDNTGIMSQIARKRLELAKLMGYKTYADYALQHTMAKSPDKVMALLDNLRESYSPAQKKEFAEISKFAAENLGFKQPLQAWDYSYLANKLKMHAYSYDEESLRPYFELNNTINGVFGLATKLYGLQFKENDKIAVYHPDVKAFDVQDADGSYLGVIYTDFFPRDTKSPGAWMTDFKSQFIKADGTNSRPHVSIVMNFTKPTDSVPSLLTPYEVETFLHEFGHALHGLLANSHYSSLSGTNVYRDFVELPSQFNENYLTQPEFLNSFARHYITGETIPAVEVEKIVSSAQFGAAYSCLRQLSFGYLDMAWHSITDSVANPAAFEQEAISSVSMFPDVAGSLTSPQFSHIFSGGYAAGYYSYKWAEVLDADAFSMFEENGIFNHETAQKFRKNVLEKGGTEDPAQLYKNFRGREATIDALLKRDGIKKPEPSKNLKNVKDI